MKKSTWLIIGIILAALIISAVVYWIYLRKNSTPTFTPATPGTTSSLPASQSTTNAISIKNFAFDPSTTTVAKGTTVTWTNNDSVGHTIDGGSFKSNDFPKGSTYSYTFTVPGTYDYRCGIHPFMTGQIIVTP